MIEAVFEDFDIKSAVFNTLNEVCDESTILASNTSSLSVNELALRREDQTDLLDYISSITLRKTDSSKSFQEKIHHKIQLQELYNIAEDSARL